MRKISQFQNDVRETFDKMHIKEETTMLWKQYLVNMAKGGFFEDKCTCTAIRELCNIRDGIAHLPLVAFLYIYSISEYNYCLNVWSHYVQIACGYIYYYSKLCLVWIIIDFCFRSIL